MYLNFFAEIGIAGALSFFYVFFAAIRTGFNKGKDKDADDAELFSNGLALALISVALGGLTDNVVFNVPTSILLWFTMALIMKRESLCTLQN